MVCLSVEKKKAADSSWTLSPALAESVSYVRWEKLEGPAARETQSLSFWIVNLGLFPAPGKGQCYQRMMCPIDYWIFLHIHSDKSL